MSQQQPETVEQWESIIARLQADLNTTTATEADCRHQRRDLSLSVALGHEPAKAQASLLELRGVELALETQTLREALEQARNGLQGAQDALRATQRREQGERLRRATERRMEASRALDATFSKMAEALVEWLTTGEAVQAVSGDTKSLQARGNLPSAIWYHLSAAGLTRTTAGYRTIADAFSGETRPSPNRWRPMAHGDQMTTDAVEEVASA